jgi:ribonuclease D
MRHYPAWVDMQTQTHTSTLERLLTEKEAAEVCRFTPRGMIDLRNAGKVPYIRLGRSIRYNAASLRAYLARLEKGGA